MTTAILEKPAAKSAMEELLEKDAIAFPKVGDVIEGKVIAVSKSEVHLDIEGITTGVIRGPELVDESGEYSNLQIGETAAATVVDLENENGEMELSFRQAGHKRAWDSLDTLKQEGKIVSAYICEANKGGVIVRVGRVSGFLPVSQLATEHYPRVEGGDRSKILERLQQYVGKTFQVKVIDVAEGEEKLIVSEKAAWEESRRDILNKYKIGDIVEGRVTGVVNFGAFVEFDEGLEGLVHISELAWQRIDDPRDIVRVGDQVKAQVIAIEGSKISLSMKKLIADPWKLAAERYTVGQRISGKILKTNTFGAFVELDRDIHGLVHISELSDKLVKDPSEIVKPGDTHEFKIISIEPNEHRLGLTLKGAKEKEKKADAEATAEAEPSEDPAPVLNEATTPPEAAASPAEEPEKAEDVAPKE